VFSAYRTYLGHLDFTSLMDLRSEWWLYNLTEVFSQGYREG